MTHPQNSSILRSRITGALLGGALGEAHAGTAGGLVLADATSLTLYTVDGLTEALEWANDGVAADETACLWLAYLRWLRTEGGCPPSSAPAPPLRWIDRQEVLGRRGRPDAASVRALSSGEMGSRRRPLELDDPGPGALQRSAPFGLMVNVPPAMIEKLSLDGAAITHGNPAAQIPAAAFAALMHELVTRSASLPEAVRAAADSAAKLGDHALSDALRAVNPGSKGGEPADAAGVLYEAVRLATTTADDDGATASRALLAAAAGQQGPAAHAVCAVAGAIVGALHGDEALPATASGSLEGSGVVLEMAGRFASAMGV